MVKIKDITQYLERIAPLSYQEPYDNCGLLTGDEQQTANGALVTLDCTEPVIDEALDNGCNLIIAHHPIWFQPLKSLTGKTYVERTIIKAIKQDVAIYALHTNLDNIKTGVNLRLAEKLGLSGLEILQTKSTALVKLVTFSPKPNTAEVLRALHRAGAGDVGNYRDCSFVTEGTGTFRPNEQAQPHIGKTNQLERVDEDRIEVILPGFLKHQVLSALFETHPYEEVAYYLQELINTNQNIGSGMTGLLETPMRAEDFLDYVKERIGTPCLRHTELNSATIQKVGICGGAGSFLTSKALETNCDAFVTSDIKYHDFFDADGKLLLVDIGHYESEVATKELVCDIIKKKFSKFAVRLSTTDTNPIRYL
ncbi:MAG: GTP cyclohydrolase 1 type 2 [Cyclobacteriaceae bacterium]|nr:MAG: GTP cyclohydrolase 1 type 2 [Cyclobacteriaceae bacterium]